MSQSIKAYNYMLFKLAQHLDSKYQLKVLAEDYYEPGRVPPAFKAGDKVIVTSTGRKATYISPVTWLNEPGRSVVHYEGTPLFKKDYYGGKTINFSYVDDLDLQLDNLEAVAGKVYGPYTRQNGRKIVIIRNDDGSLKTKSYPKFLMEQHLGRELDKDNETVDHWDSNKDNNDINNLRIVPRSEHSADDTRRVKLVKLKCLQCKKKFERSPRLVRDKAKKGNSGPFCSRSCAGKYSRMIQLKLIDKLPVQKHVDSKYFKRKYLKDSK